MVSPTHRSDVTTIYGQTLIDMVTSILLLDILWCWENIQVQGSWDFYSWSSSLSSKVISDNHSSSYCAYCPVCPEGHFVGIAWRVVFQTGSFGMANMYPLLRAFMCHTSSPVILTVHSLLSEIKTLGCVWALVTMHNATVSFFTQAFVHRT